jgi:hypothetical protein
VFSLPVLLQACLLLVPPSLGRFLYFEGWLGAVNSRVWEWEKWCLKCGMCKRKEGGLGGVFILEIAFNGVGWRVGGGRPL